MKNYKNFTYASAFAGIGGMTMGLEPLGGKCVAAWEIDPTSKRQYAQEAHRLLHPHIPVHGDICEVDTSTLPNFDVLCFTPPCQSFSVAGKRGGFEDTRGTLTFEALRIAKDKRPKVLFMENVKGLVNHDKGNTMGVIISAINDIGYTVDFTVLNSKYFDVAQNRERVYLIAVRDDLITPEPWHDTKGTTMLPKAKRKYQEESAKTFNFPWPKEEAVRTKLRDFLEDCVDEKYYLSEDKTHALIANLKTREIERLLEIDSPKDVRSIYTPDVGYKNMNGNRIGIKDEFSPTITVAYPHGIIKGLPIREATTKGYAIANEGDAVNFQFPNSNTRRGRVGKQIANTLEASNINQGVIEEIRPILTPDRLEKRKNGRRFKEDGEESFTITAIDRHGVAIGEYPKYRIRKLTPRECLRLQSIPEHNIDTILENFSDSRAYKFAGNGLTINLITAIGKEIISFL